MHQSLDVIRSITMRDTLERQLSQMSVIPPAPHVYGRVIARVARVRRTRARIRVAFMGVLSLASFVGLIEAGRYSSARVVDTGLYNYVSLLFTDSNVVISHWTQYALTLAESVPATGIALTLASVFALLYFVQQASKDIATAFITA